MLSATNRLVGRSSGTTNYYPVILSLSKRCGPSSTSLASYLKTAYMYGAEVMLPGQHTVWTPTTLPLGRPKAANLAMLETARTTL
jgi:hypothetical protein